MLLHYIGHAGWLFEEGGCTIICDPWQSEHGAFYSSWFPFPANDYLHLPAEVDGIFVSHAHQDHFSPDTLARFSRRTPIIIANFDDPVLAEELYSLGFSDIRRLTDGECARIGCFSLQIFRDEDCGMYHDSAVVVRSPSARVLNLNDCRLAEQWLHNLGQIDLLLGQFSGANWYPVAYEYSKDEADRLGAAKRRRGLQRLAQNAERCGAAITIPCAGPPAFLDPSLWHLNDVENSEKSPFPMMDTAVEFLQQQGRSAFLAMPGDTIEVQDGSLALKDRKISVQEVYGDRAKYLRAYAQRKLPIIKDRIRRLKPDANAGATLKRELNRVVQSSQIFCHQVRSAVRFQLVGVENGDVLLDCQKGAREVRDYQGETVQYRFTIDHRLVSDLLSGKRINFEDVFLSMRFSAWRSPDIFDASLFTLLVNFDSHRLNHSEQKAARAEDLAEDSTFEIIHHGERFVIQRRCPHMAGDLSLVGEVKDGLITCTRHGWQFRLADGVCLNVSAPPLAVRRLDV